MKQVVAIHGGDSFSDYETFLKFLRDERTETLASFKPRSDWKANLQVALGSEYEVLLPRMPNKQNAKYLEWKIWFEKLASLLNNDAILIGHSLGGSFLARYLSTERFSKKIAATFLVAAPYSTDNENATSTEFTAPESLGLLAEQGSSIFLYQSSDDPVVPFGELAKYQAALPHAIARIFSDRGHFNQDDFPELVADIKSLP